MEYTKTQLINAFCEMRGYNAEVDGTKAEFLANVESQIQPRLDARRLNVEARLAKMPTTAKELMKRKAVAYLVKQEAELLNANTGGEL